MEQFYIYTHTYIWANLLYLLGAGHPSSCSDTGAPGSQSFELQTYTSSTLASAFGVCYTSAPMLVRS